jgi:hypothetical protein
VNKATWWGVIAIAALVAALVLPSVGYTQAISGDLVGTVVDKSAAGVPNATVAVENVDTGLKVTVQANDKGEYRFTNLPIGAYNITASAAGFATATVSRFPVELNKANTVQITLQVGQQVTTIEVTGAPAPIDTTTPQIEGTFNAQQTADLPTSSIGLGVLNLALLEPGIASAQGIGAGTGPSVGGMRPRDNNFTIDGVDNNSKTVTGPLVFVPNDAVQEFSALQNQFNPEFGHSNGGQFNTVVMSGTNQYHGKAYEYFQNRNLNAVDATVIQSLGPGASNPRFDLNRVGGQVGGPILKNKLFFFGNFEYNPLGQASTVAGGACSPTAAGYSTLAATPGVSATNLAILQKYAPASTGTCGVQPNITVGGATVPLGKLPIVAPNFLNGDYLVTSMDYDLSSKDQVRGRYIYNRVVGIDTNANLPVFFLSSPTKYHLVALSEFHTFTPNIANEFRVGFNRYENETPAGNFQYPGLDSFPNIGLSDLNLNIGPDPNAPQFTIFNLYQASENLSWTHGNHSFKLGVEGRKFISPQQFTQRSRGDYEYKTTNRFLLDQNPESLAQRSTGAPVYYGDQAGVAWYANDIWRIRPNLSLNLGLRYEYMTIPVGERLQKLNIAASVPGVLDFSEPRAAKNNYMPRIGLAWSPGSSGTTSIRAGFGMGYDVNYDNIGILSLPPQLSGTVTVPKTPVVNNFLKNGGIPPGNGRSFPSVAAAQAHTSTHLVVDQKNPAAIEWDLGVQHSFGKSYTVEARYLGTHGYHLDVQEIINLRPVVTPTHFLPTFFTAPSQATLDALPLTLGGNGNGGILDEFNNGAFFVPAFVNAGFTNITITQFTPVGNSIYHGLALQATRRLGNGLSFNAAYTWSHAIDDSTADFHSTNLVPRRPQDFQNLSADRSTSSLDHRHRITLSALYDLPYFKSGNWFRKNLVGNWLIAPVYTFQSGGMFDPQSETDSNLNVDAAGDRTIINPTGIPGTGSDAVPLFRTNTCAALPNNAGQRDACFQDNTVAYVAVNPKAQYVVAQPGALATAGRNLLQGRPINNIDVTVGKRFNITERMRFEFQAQFQNLLNHPQYIPGFINRIDDQNPIQTAIFTGGGVQTLLNPAQPAFNDPTQAFPSNARIITLVGKFVF